MWGGGRAFLKERVECVQCSWEGAGGTVGEPGLREEDCGQEQEAGVWSTGREAAASSAKTVLSMAEGRS